MTDLRLAAAQIIAKVTAGRSLTDCFDSSLNALKDAKSVALVKAICFGVCRYYTRLDVILRELLQKPIKPKDSEVYALLLVGLYQLIAMRLPPYAAVTETVNAAKKLPKPWASGLINAVLRKYLRESEQLEKVVQANEAARYAHPQWWIEKIRQAWPAQWQEILEENNRHPPLALRVNQRRLSREDYLKRLQEFVMPAKAGLDYQYGRGLTGFPIKGTRNGLVLDTPVAIDELPGFAEGDVSVQDGGAQWAAELLDLKPGQRVLDACAAPGGKLTHLLEVESQLAEVIAVEKAPARFEAIKANLKRHHLSATCILSDANDLDQWWDGQLFDRILLDAPCSASGVVRRHPDIKLLRQKSDVHHLAKEQGHLLGSLWPLLKSGGLLLYVTCSIFPEENEQVIRAFLTLHSDAVEEKIIAESGLALEIGRQLLPGMDGMDGFYYAKLRKVVPADKPRDDEGSGGGTTRIVVAGRLKLKHYGYH